MAKRTPTTSKAEPQGKAHDILYDMEDDLNRIGYLVRAAKMATLGGYPHAVTRHDLAALGVVLQDALDAHEATTERWNAALKAAEASS